MRSKLGELEGALRSAGQSELEAKVSELWDRVYDDTDYVVLGDALSLAQQVLELSKNAREWRNLARCAGIVQTEVRYAFAN
ncbi:hypothetical protein [Curtobacterium luteum]|uniref:hypothetical protein n=1 Tax=Curtobacterium luteum TaxID=33881 RepID=UPI00195867B7|nr:hypothetical protein [Curtobacterium luteum]